MTNTEALTSFARYLQSLDVQLLGEDVDITALVDRYRAQLPGIEIKNMDEVTVPAPGDLLDNAWLAEDGAVSELGDPWVKVSDIIGYLGSTRPVRVDLEGDFYADPDNDHPELAEAYVNVYDYQRTVRADNTVWITLHFEDFPSVAFPSDHALPLDR